MVLSESFFALLVGKEVNVKDGRGRSNWFTL